MATNESFYHHHAMIYPQAFRAHIDYTTPESDRPIAVGVILIFALVGLSSINTSDSKDVATQTQRAFLGVLLCLVTYCFLQTKDTLIVRPHPGVWRIVHAIGLFYLLLVTALLVMDVDLGRTLLKYALQHEADEDNPFKGTCDLDCELSFRTLKIQLTKVWAPCHVVGFLLKMVLFRDWAFCLLYSFLFEVCELSFQWALPEFQECWWDSMFVDFAFCNIIGMALGSLLLRVLKSPRYNWTGGKFFGLNTVIEKFLPFYWNDLDWAYFLTAERLFWGACMILVCLLAELNSFLLMYSLNIPPYPYSWLVGYRLMIVIAVAIPATAEHYDYLNTKRRIGHNVWLILMITIVELFVGIKYGQSRLQANLPSREVILSHSLTILALAIWSFCRFSVVGTLEYQIRVANKLHAVDFSDDTDRFEQSASLQSNSSKSKSCLTCRAYCRTSLRLESRYASSIGTAAASAKWQDIRLRRRKFSGAAQQPDTMAAEQRNVENENSSKTLAGKFRNSKEADSQKENKANVCNDIAVTPKSTTFNTTTAMTPTNSEPENLAPKDSLRIELDETLRREKWGTLYDIASAVVKIPVVASFLPYILLIGNWQR